MIIEKVINNNVVSSLDEKKREIVVMGRGIGFQKKVGDKIDESLVEKVFSLPSKESTGRFEEIISDIPYEYLTTAEDVIAFARKYLGKELSKNIYITLTDHLYSAIEREKNGTTVKNELLWEIRKYYTSEFQMGKKALRIVKENLGIQLSEDEAGFIALHLVNAEVNGKIQESAVMPSLIKDILNIVTYHFQQELEEDSITYERFVTHLKFFAQRLVSKEGFPEGDHTLSRLIIAMYQEAYQCTDKINEYVKKRMGRDIPEDELGYLTIHIEKIRLDLAKKHE